MEKTINPGCVISTELCAVCRNRGAEGGRAELAGAAVWAACGAGLAGRWGAAPRGVRMALTSVLHPNPSASTEPHVVNNVFRSALSAEWCWLVGAVGLPCRCGLGAVRGQEPSAGLGDGVWPRCAKQQPEVRVMETSGQLYLSPAPVTIPSRLPHCPGGNSTLSWWCWAGAGAGQSWWGCGHCPGAVQGAGEGRGCGVPVPGCSQRAPIANGESWAQPLRG